MPWTVDDIPNQSGRVVVLVGPHGPEGLATARVFAERGAHVVLVSASMEALIEVRTELLAEFPSAGVGIAAINEATAAAATSAAQSVLAVHPRIDLLINNACPLLAVGAPSLDSVPAIDFPASGHFAFTAALMPGLVASPSARIVTVTPRSDERDGHPDIDPATPVEVAQDVVVDPSLSDQTISLLDFPLELHRRLVAAGSHVQSLAVDPGRDSDTVVSMLDRTAGGLSRRYDRYRATRRAAPHLQAATDPSARGGELYTPMFNTSGPPMSLPMCGTNEATAQRHWDTTATLTDTAFTNTTTIPAPTSTAA